MAFPGTNGIGGVFSTSVEVFLEKDKAVYWLASLLHVRGGVSSMSRTTAKHLWSSPRPWRCFPDELRIRSECSVFSTSVEVFPTGWWMRFSKTCLLHVRGGVSWYQKFYNGLILVFSTSVEVFLATFETKNVC